MGVAAVAVDEPELLPAAGVLYWKTIWEPSGEKSGKASVAPRLVTWCFSVPFCFITQISLGLVPTGELNEHQAIDLPSAE